MRRGTRVAVTAAVVTALPLAGAVSDAAAPKKSKDFAFESKGTAINPQGAGGDPSDPTTYEQFPFTIKPGEKNGTINVHVEWLSPADDWDLYVFRKQKGQLQGIGQSASAPPGTEENASADSQGVPWKPGEYVIRVVNYAAVVPDFRGTVRFGPYIPYNKDPVAKLKAPKRVEKGERVTLDASGSRDPDGRITSYAFDLDNDGFMETRTGKRPRVRRVLEPGTHYVAVRVTDNARPFAGRAYAKRKIVVEK